MAWMHGCRDRAARILAAGAMLHGEQCCNRVVRTFLGQCEVISMQRLDADQFVLFTESW